MISFMKYNIDIIQRRHRLLHEKESREEYLLSNSLYLPIYLEISLLIFLNLILSNHSNHYRTSIGPLSNYFQSLLNIYRTTIESIRPLLKHRIFTKCLSDHYWTSIEPLRTSIGLSNHYRTTFNHYWTSIRPLSDYYRTSIRPLLYHYRTFIERLLNHIKHLSNHYQTFIKLLLNIFQILIVRYIIIYLSILNYRGINETYLC